MAALVALRGQAEQSPHAPALPGLFTTRILDAIPPDFEPVGSPDVVRQASALIGTLPSLPSSAPGADARLVLIEFPSNGDSALRIIVELDANGAARRVLRQSPGRAP